LEPFKVELPKKSEAEVKLETKLANLSKDSSKPLLDIFARLKSESVSETLLRDFVNLTKACATEKVSCIVSVNHVIAAREIGITKSLSDVGSSFQKGNFNKNKGRG